MTTPNARVAADARWRKSSYSTASNNCVEVAPVAGACAVRDSKNPDAGHLVFDAGTWKAFVADLKCGRYDYL